MFIRRKWYPCLSRKPALLVVDSGKYKFTKKLNLDIDFELVLATKTPRKTNFNIL